jgi:predicted TIM-barrel fold metal-dependent hydrolase
MKIMDFHNHIMLPDLEGKVLLEEMNRNNVEKSLLLGVTPRYHRFRGHIGMNEQVRHLLAKHPDRLIGGFEINPLDIEEAWESLKIYPDAGFKVVKMFPLLGYYPDDEILYPLYEEIEKLGLMVLYHMGGTAISPISNYKSESKLSSKYGRPRYVDGPAFRFPGIDFIMAHMGVFDTEEAAYMAANHPNVYLDCSCTNFVPVFKGLKANEDYLIKPVDFKKILWGLDGDPKQYPTLINRTMELMTELGWQEHIPDVFYNNAIALLQKHK